jgi:hypothetical protein
MYRREAPLLQSASAERLTRVQYKIYESNSPAHGSERAGACLGGGSVFSVRRAGERSQPHDVLCGIVEAPYLSCVQSGLLFIHMAGRCATSDGAFTQPEWLGNSQNSRFALIVLDAQQTLEAARRGEHGLSIVWEAVNQGQA